MEPLLRRFNGQRTCVYVRSMQYGGRPVMFTQVVVFGNNLLQAELDQRPYLLFLYM